jgi:hypothetical protein
MIIFIPTDELNIAEVVKGDLRFIAEMCTCVKHSPFAGEG